MLNVQHFVMSVGNKSFKFSFESLKQVFQREGTDIKRAFNLMSGQYFIENYKNGCKEAWDLGRNYKTRFQQKSLPSKVFSLARVSSVSAPFILVPDQPLHLRLLSSTILASACFLHRINSNNHKNALSVPIATALSVESFMLGAEEFSAFTAVAAVRNFIMATLPDEKELQSLRNKFGKAVGAIGIGAIGVMSQSLWGILPAASLALSTAASVQVKSLSHRARALRFGVYVSNISYSLGYSNSSAALVTGMVGGANEMVTAIENDVPQKSKEGKDLSKLEQMFGYFSCLFFPDKRDNFRFKKDLVKDSDSQQALTLS